MDDDLKKTFFILVLISIVVLVLWLSFSGKRTYEMKNGGEKTYNDVAVYGMQLLEGKGDKNGQNVFTVEPSVYHVPTQYGIFEVNTSGPYNLYVAFVPIVHVGDSLESVTVIGASPDLISETYPSIVEFQVKCSNVLIKSIKVAETQRQVNNTIRKHKVYLVETSAGTFEASYEGTIIRSLKQGETLKSITAIGYCKCRSEFDHARIVKIERWCIRFVCLCFTS